jgi:hypothetical protein
MSATASRQPVALAHGNVRGAIVTAAQLAPRLNSTRNVERRRVQICPLQLVLERSDRALGIVLLHRQPDRLRLQALNVLTPSFRWRWQAFEQCTLAFRLAQHEMRKGAELALDLIFARTPLARLIAAAA